MALPVEGLEASTLIHQYHATEFDPGPVPRKRDTTLRYPVFVSITLGTLLTFYLSCWKRMIIILKKKKREISIRNVSSVPRWEDNIKMDLQEVGEGFGDCMDLAQDRDRWRALVSTVRNLRFPKIRRIS